MGLTLFPNNTNVIQFEDDGLLIDAETGDIIPAAVVEITLTDLAGVNIAGQSWPLSMPAVGSQPGNYRAELDHTIALAGEQEVVGVLTADDGPGAHAEWNLRCPVTKRFE